MFSVSDKEIRSCGNLLQKRGNGFVTPEFYLFPYYAIFTYTTMWYIDDHVLHPPPPNFFFLRSNMGGGGVMSNVMSYIGWICVCEFIEYYADQ